MLNRYMKTVPDYTPPSQFKIGRDNATPTETDTTLTNLIPISNGTVNDDGDNNMTGDMAGSNSTDNTTTFKPGAGVYDDTAQNLIGVGTSISKIWYIANLATAGTVVDNTKYFGLWLYIKDAATLAKFRPSNAVRIQLGDDDSNAYELLLDAADFEVGWNWITSYPDAVEDLTEAGSVAGATSAYFSITVITNASADTIASGDLIYDQLRTYEDSDLVKNFVTGYPTLNETSVQSTIRCYLNSTEANGFNIDSIGIFNSDATPVLTDIDQFIEESKADTDEIAFIIINEVE